MLKTGLALATAAFAVSPFGPFPLTRDDEPNGRWEARLKDQSCGDGVATEGLCVRLTIERGNRFHNSSWDLSIPAADLKGLGARSVDYEQSGVHFELNRAAGKFSFAGQFKAGRGDGEFVFLADRGFAAALERLGYDKPSELDMMSLAVHDVSQQFVGDLKRLGYGGDLNDVVSFSTHEVTPDFIEEVQRLGYQHPSSDDLVSLKIHEVTPDFIRDLQKDGGERPSLDRVISMRIHGADGSFRRELAEAWENSDHDRDHDHDYDDDDDTDYDDDHDFDDDEAVSFRIHGIDGNFIRRMADAGLRGLDGDELISLKIQGVDPDFVRDMLHSGLEDLDVDDLISARIQGVDPEYVRDMVHSGIEHLDLDDLISLKIQGVSPDFVRDFHRDDPDGDADDAVDAWLNGRHHRHHRHRGI